MKFNRITVLRVAIVVALLNGGSLTAATIAHDPFNYLSGGGTLHNKNGGTGWAGAWATNGLDNLSAVADSSGSLLSFQPVGAALVDGGVEAVDFYGPSNQPVAFRALSAARTTDFYVAYLVRVNSGSWTDTDTFTLHLGVDGTGTSTLNFGLRGTNGFIVRTGTGAPLAGDSFGAPILAGTTYWLVARVSKPGGSGTFDQMDVWMNPNLSSSNSPNATLNLTAGSGLAGLSHLMFRAAALESGDVVRVDELRVAEAWTDILVPGVTVALTNPSPAASFYAPATILLEAAASSSVGTVTNVEFYAGATKIGEDASAPYSFLWTNVPAGAYSLSARARDDAGNVGYSSTNLVSVLDTNNTGTVSGELKKWHRVTIAFNGPMTSETSSPNPFRDYRLNVTFTHTNSGKTYLVPGFYAADGNAADTSADSGNQWHVRFSPDEVGTWNYVASFRTGSNVATNTSATAGSATSFDGAGGSFVIAASDKTGRDFRGKGLLQYVGKHHLRFADSGEYFLKCGADAPENFLAYDDIDDTPNDQKNQPNLRKSWAPHAGDYNAVDAAAYTWQGGKGSNILGAIKYLSSEGMNVFSFLTFNVDGDDDNVFPHRLVTDVAAYEALADNARWAGGVLHHDRFDVSKLEQWERIFSYGDKKGMYLHFKTQETENDQLMDGGNVGVERQLYYRELIARFGHHLALNWNLGEENTNTEQQEKDMAQYFWDHDPYRHNIVLHTFPAQKGTVYTPLLGNASKLTGLSLQTSQTNFTEVFPHTKEWVEKSAQAGKPWVVACDEPGDAGHSLVPDSDVAVYDPQRNNARKNALWGNVMAGGAGLEWYFGYQHAHSDLTCQDFRSRDLWWDQCRYLLHFFASNAVPFWEMRNDNTLLSDANNYCLFKTNEVYVVFLKSAAVNTLNLSGTTTNFSVAWYDPRNGGALQTGSVETVAGGGVVSLGAPPVSSANDWVALLLPSSYVPPALKVEVYNSVTNFNWVCPAGVTNVQVECWGGGGAGGSAKNIGFTNYSAGGGGGAGGAYARRASVPVTPGSNYSLTIPAAVVAPDPATADDGARADGFAVIFVGNGGVTVTAAGGQGGATVILSAASHRSGLGGAGSTNGCVGDVGGIFGGGNGTNATAAGQSGAGGGGAGDANPGGDAVDKTAGVGGVSGGGLGGTGKSGNGNGNVVGAGPGGGGGGARAQLAVGTGSYFGALGAVGQIIITYAQISAEPPVLNHSLSGGNLVLSWSGSGFKVQSRTNLTSGTWSDVPGGTASPVNIAPTQPAAYFRLIEQ